MPRFAVVSLGCAKNLVDTEIMMGQLLAAAWELTQDFSQAELILVNTCGFIASAKQESINHIIEMAGYKQPGQGCCKTLVVAGCLVQRYLEELEKAIPEVDYWLGLGELGEINGILAAGRTAPKTRSTAPPFLNNVNLPRFQATRGHTAFVKIAEGCDHRCSYCAIPIIKGGFRSRSAKAIVQEISDLVKNGVKEINLIAQDITMYGHDLLPRMGLEDLLEQIMNRAKPSWLRLLYAYPAGVGQALLRLIGAEPSLCKYLDLPLQHINARILRQMNRSDTTESIIEKLTLIREMVPEITLRTTFITGFPGETETEWAELRDFIRQGFFQHVGIFAYSREEGTAAYRMKDQVKKPVREARRRLLLLEQQQISSRYLAGMVGKRQTILIDQVTENGLAIGRSQALAPESDGVIYVKDFHGNAGQMTTGLVTGHDAYNLWAKELLSS